MKNNNHILILIGLIALAAKIMSYIDIISNELGLLVIVLSIIILTTFILLRSKERLKLDKLFLIYSFIIILTIITFGKKETTSLENRTLSKFPEWRWSNVWQFFTGYQEYFDDCFPYRNTFIDSFGKFKYELLKITNVTDRVMIGKNGWLFLNEPEYIKPISTPFTKEELRRFNYNLVVTTKWFEKHNIKYYLTIPPVKPRIYNETLPEFLKIKLSFSKINQIRDYLTEMSSINFIDYQKELLEEKNNREIYYKTDTHWNEYGAFVGYSKIVNTISKDFPEIIPFKLNQFNEKKLKYNSSDLLGMLGYKANYSTTLYYLELNDSIVPILTDSITMSSTANEYEKWKMPNCTNNLKIVIVRDSYSQHLKKFLSLNFSESVYLWFAQVPIKTIAKEKPVIVLHEILERFTSSYLKLPPEIESDTTFTNQFNIKDF